LRVYFTPLTLLGFYPSELSPRDEPDASSVILCPLGVAFLTNWSPRNYQSAGAIDFDLGSSSLDLSAAFRALLPVSELVVDHTVLPDAVARCSLGFLPL
jgi:hypothetical protein